jgi:hypothetical protein
LVYEHISKTIDFYLGELNFHSEFGFLKIRLVGIKEMMKFGELNGVIQSLLEVVPLIDSHFFE